MIKLMMRNFNTNLNSKYFLKCLVKNILYYDFMYDKYFRYTSKLPYIIGISGSVAVGKSTMSKWLQIVLKKYFVKKKFL